MTEQYFSDRPRSESRPHEVEVVVLGRTLRFLTDSGVFSKDGLDRGSRLLIEAARVEPGARILDLGAGWGAVGVSLGAARRARPTLVERNARAAELCRENLRRNQVDGEVREGDGFAPVAGERFRHILLNPPIRAGKRVYYPWLEQAAEHLDARGQLWVVIRTGQGAKSLRAELVRVGAEVEDREIEGGYRVYSARWS